MARSVWRLGPFYIPGWSVIKTASRLLGLFKAISVWNIIVLCLNLNFPDTLPLRHIQEGREIQNGSQNYVGRTSTPTKIAKMDNQNGVFLRSKWRPKFINFCQNYRRRLFQLGLYCGFIHYRINLIKNIYIISFEKKKMTLKSSWSNFGRLMP